MNKKTAIVGAGTAGMMCAAELEKLGEGVVVVEKKHAIGENAVCAGLFNISGLRRLGLERGDYVVNEVRGARVIAPSGAVAEIDGRESKAVVVDRGAFDRFVAGGYEGEIRFGEDVKSAEGKNGGYMLKTAKGEIKVGKVVLATGHDMSLHRNLGLGVVERFISTSQYEIEGVATDPDFVEVYLGSVSPGFFAWVIPMDENKARVGLGVSDSGRGVHHYMQAFLKRLKRGGRFKKKNKILRRSGGLIPVFDPQLSLNNGGAYLVGDAAGQVKATTGGGVMMGGLAAKALANAIHEGGDYDSGLADINRELNNHLLIRKVMNRFGDEQYEHMIEFLKKPSIKNLVEEHGDMDFVKPLMEGVMKNPMLAMHAMKYFGRGLLI